MSFGKSMLWKKQLTANKSTIILDCSQFNHKVYILFAIVNIYNGPSQDLSDFFSAK